jgi:hypothetical protein
MLRRNRIMALPLEKLLQDTVSDLDALTPEKLQTLLQETVRVFSDIQAKASSNDPKDKEEALSTALSIKESLQAHTDELCKKMGIEPSDLGAYAQEFTLFAEETDLKKQIDAFKEQIIPPEKVIKKNTKTPKTWLVG